MLEITARLFSMRVYIIIAAGGLVMLVGFFGCYGAVRESQCLLGLFFTCLLVIFGAEVAAGVFGFFNKDQITGEIKEFYDKTANNATVNSYHVNTCHEAIEEFFNSKLFIVSYVGIGIAGVMIIGMIFSMVLCCAIRNSREDGDVETGSNERGKQEVQVTRGASVSDVIF
ncbi:hypothetical protein cypCar_00014599 [Cyprinus carpio]|nr:hypothetical protein cypCar_00014599 [Cyprinus carpio]